MEWFLDPRVWVPLVITTVGFVASWASYKQKSDSQQSAISEIKNDVSDLREVLGNHKTAIALLDEKQQNNATVVADLVKELKDVVRDLQKVAIKIAIGDYGKTQG